MRAWRTGGQRGQATTELALIAPLFAALLALFGFWTTVTLTRLELIQLTRDAALLLAQDADHWLESPGKQQAHVRELARHYPLLDPDQVELEMQAMPLPGGLDFGHGGFAKLLAGAKVCVRYRLRPGGLAAVVFPDGLRLEEWGAVQGDPWRNPAQSVLKAFLGD